MADTNPTPGRRCRPLRDRFFDWAGYGSMSKGRQGEGHVGAHRLSWQIHFGPIPEGMFVCHRCDNPPCCNPRHLFLGTPADNVADMISKGRANPKPPRGERHFRTTLTEDQVREIRSLGAAGVVLSEIGRRFGISKSAAKHIVRRRRWKHVA